MVDVKEYNLGEDVMFLDYSSEEEWHNLRKEGIGGSDAGAIMGLNKYTSPLKLYRIKKGIYTEDISDNVYIKKGKDLENLIFEKYVKPDFDSDTWTVLHPEHVFVNRQYPWLRANCDSLVVCKDNILKTRVPHIVIEIKWVSEWAEVNWNGDEYGGIPASYYAQVQHYMLVTGAPYAIIYAMFDKDWKVQRYKIPFNKSFALKLLSQTEEFYNNMCLNKAPKPIATLDKEELPRVLEKTPTVVEESEEMDQAIASYLAVKEEIKQLEKKLDTYYNLAVEQYIAGKRPTKLFKMTMSTCTSARFDTERFAKEHPELCSQYQKTTEYTRTTIKRGR